VISSSHEAAVSCIHGLGIVQGDYRYEPDRNTLKSIAAT
jgi:hypothetical protein